MRAGVYGRLMAGSGLAAAAANWTTSDLMGLGWLVGTLEMDTLARIPARAMDGVRGFVHLVREAGCFVLVSGIFYFILSSSIPIVKFHKDMALEHSLHPLQDPCPLHGWGKGVVI